MTGGKNKAGGVALAVIGVVTLGAVVLSSTLGSDETTSFTDDDTRLYTEASSYSTSPPIQGLTEQQSQQLATALATSESVHGVCFGWALTDGSDKTTQRGSSKGPTVPADTCPKWAEVQVSVANAPGNGDYDYDYASIATRTSSDLTGSPGVNEFTALGFTAEALVEEPALETGRAAQALPLLLVESGALPAPPPEKGDPNAAPAQGLPPTTGSDGGFGTWMWITLLTLATVVFGILGLRARSRDKRHGPPTPGPPPVVGYPVAPPPGPPQGFPPGPQQPPYQGFPAQGRPAPPWPGPPPGQPNQPPPSPPPGYQYPPGPPPPQRGPQPGPPPQQPGPPPGWPGQQPPR